MKTKAKVEAENAEVEKVVEPEVASAAAVSEILEAEAADSVPAPEISVAYDDAAYLRARNEIVDAYDKRNPEYVHIWCPQGVDQDFLNMKGFVVVKQKDALVRHGDDMLVKLPKARFKAQRKNEQERSWRSVAGLAKKGQEYRFNRKRDPKAPLGKED